MATVEDSNNPPPVSQEQQQQQQLQQQHSSAIPQYPEMIIAAIESLNETNGSNKSAISKQMETAYPDLPPAHTTLLSHHLNKMKQSGELVLIKNNYMKPDPNAPPKRGRGRPPKPKVPLPPGTVISPPRPRGRPPKPRDPFAPISSPKKKISSPGTGRPRGRPPKSPSASASAPPPPPPTSSAVPQVKRGRGRPPKVKPAVAPVAG